MINKNLVLLSYGKESEYLRAIFCILSISAWFPTKIRAIRINIYTDNPQYFKNYLPDLKASYVLLTPELLNDMLANTDYIHRRKVSVIDQTFSCYPNEDVIFIDSDTFFTSAYTGIFENYEKSESYMHRLEYNLKDGLAFFELFGQADHPKAFMDYIKNRIFKINDKHETFGETDLCWNSGVLGMSKHFALYLPDVFRLTDDFYANSKWFISEQLAFGLLLQRNTKIKPAEKFVVHYWGRRQKILFDELLNNFFKSHTIKDLNDRKIIKKITRKWKQKFELDLILEQAIIALENKNWNHGVKKSIQAILKSPFNGIAYKEILDSLRSK